ncbi:MAG: hypothetical protein ACLFOY_05090 [Desulfatibacillaceae bacterium]
MTEKPAKPERRILPDVEGLGANDFAVSLNIRLSDSGMARRAPLDLVGLMICGMDSEWANRLLALAEDGNEQDVVAAFLLALLDVEESRHLSVDSIRVIRYWYNRSAGNESLLKEAKRLARQWSESG